ncbi:MAG: PDZ domain-containing protein [Firmicutes bacterium]|nr:PDZ domain-containing protein [Bacillota bacterium]
MFPIFEIMPMLLQQMLSFIFNPLFYLVIVLVALQYRRMLNMRQKFFGFSHGKWWPDALQATGYGFLGGLLGSILMLFVGLTLSGSGLQYIWPLAILLMFIDARFLCFAYAGGILALSNIVIGWPAVSAPQVLGLVAILHMVESVLIYFSGHLGAVPAYIKVDKNRLVGGFALQRFWPIPVVALIVIGQTQMQQTGIEMPEWWPLIKPEVDAADLDTLLYSLFPVVAGLGYGDIAAARKPREKSRLSAKYLAIYSFILLVLAVLSDKYAVMALMGALFSPLGHEMVIYLNKKMEIANKPLYVPPEQGVMVLDVVPGTTAWKAGLRSGNIILTLNDVPLYSKSTLEDMLQQNPGMVEIAYISEEDQQYKRELVNLSPGKPFGMLPVPEGGERSYMEFTKPGAFIKKWAVKILRI